jgi:hypothetical protein
MKPITDHLCERLQQCSMRGQAKYGHSIDRPDLSLADWLQHAVEECADQLQYLEAARRQALKLESVPDHLPTGHTPAVPADRLLMPRRLTAEAGDKELLIGEFSESAQVTCYECGGEGCSECDGNGSVAQVVAVSWQTIKAIYAMVADHYAAQHPQPAAWMGDSNAFVCRGAAVAELRERGMLGDPRPLVYG